MNSLQVTGSSVDIFDTMELQQNNQQYYANINPELARSVARCRPANVLEVGCGAGALGAFFKKQNKSIRWDGIEFFPSAAQEAATVLDNVTEGAVEDVDLDALAATYDTIVMGDVLEHLVNPWKVLKDLARILKRRGKLCVSVPNINHWTIFATLGQGRFTYADSGLLDRTHLRFFTRTELTQAIQGAGLKIQAVESVINPHPRMDGFIKHYVQFQESIGLHNPSLAEEMRAFQWVITATK